MKKMGTEFVASGQSEGTASTPIVVGEADGGFMVVFAKGAVDEQVEIAGQKFSPVGEPIGPSFQLNTVRKKQATLRDGQSLDNGTFLVVWGAKEENNWSGGIFAQRFDKDGNKLYH